MFKLIWKSYKGIAVTAFTIGLAKTFYDNQTRDQ